MTQAQQSLVQTQSKMRDLDRRIEDLRNKLAALAPAREERTEVKVLVSVAAPVEAELAVRYQVPGASWSPLYDARLATGSKSAPPKLDLSRRASITQRSGETWQDATVQLSTTRPGSGAAAPELSVATVDFEPERKHVRAGARRSTCAERGRGCGDLSRRGPVGASQGRALRRPNARRGRAGAVPGRVRHPRPRHGRRHGRGQARLPAARQPRAALAVRTVPKVDAKAFLYAKLALPKGSPLLPGPVSLFRDGTFVGTGRLPLLVAGEEHELGFGIDDAVRVKHAIAEEKRGETGLISSSRTDQRNYKITVKNLHERAIPLTIIDQVPVALNQDIKVELTGRTAPTRATSTTSAASSPGRRSSSRTRSASSSSVTASPGRARATSSTDADTGASRWPLRPAKLRYNALRGPGARTGPRRERTRGAERKWRMSSWSAPSGATRARARSSTGSRSAPTSSCASRAATTPATRSSSATKPTSCRCCPRAWCARASSP